MAELFIYRSNVFTFHDKIERPRLVASIDTTINRNQRASK